MQLPMRTLRSLTACVAVAAFLCGATATAWADDAEETETTTVVVTQDGTRTVRLVQGKDGEFVLEPEPDRAEPARARMHVVIQKDGEDGEVRVLELRDGQWVAGDRPVRVEHEIAVQRTPGVTTTPGDLAAGRNPMSTMLRWLLTDGLAGELPNDPLNGWFEGGADVPMAGLRDALKADGWTAQSLQAWFLQHLMGGMAALHAPAPHAMRPPIHPPMRGRWYELGRGGGGSGCRCDCGRDGQRGGRMERCRPGRAWHGARQGRGDGRGPGRQPARGRGYDGGGDRGRGACGGDCGAKGRGSCGACQGRCGSCEPRGSCGSCGGDCRSRGSSGDGRRSCDACGSCGGSQGRRGSCGGDCGANGRGSARRQAWMLWNDGSGWKQRRVDAEGTVAHWGHEHAGPEGMIFHGEGTDAAPELTRMLRELIGEADEGGSDADRLAEIGVDIRGLDLLPPDLLDQIPPGVLESVLKELEGLGLGELLAPPKRGCEDCPKQGACKGGDCGKTEGAKAQGCCGTCKGECKDCPKARDGSCAGDCEDCPNKPGAEKKDCGGTCKGAAAK